MENGIPGLPWIALRTFRCECVWSSEAAAAAAAALLVIPVIEFGW